LLAPGEAELTEDSRLTMIQPYTAQGFLVGFFRSHRWWNNHSILGTAQNSNVKILITLAYGKGCVWSEEFMTEDLSEEDIVGDVFGFEAVAADGGVGAAQVAGFPGLVQGVEGGGNVLGELRARGNGDPGKEVTFVRVRQRLSKKNPRSSSEFIWPQGHSEDRAKIRRRRRG
jgi:hypothetical protein